MQVKNIMKKVVAVDHDIDIKQAAKIMSDKRIGSLIVLKKNKIAGIITEKDIMRNVKNTSDDVSKIMSKNIITISSNDSVDNAALLMAEKKIRRLPVVSGGKLVGIITATDIIANSETLNEDFFFE